MMTAADLAARKREQAERGTLGSVLVLADWLDTWMLTHQGRRLGPADSFDLALALLDRLDPRRPS